MRPHHTGDISNLLFMSDLSQSTHNSALAWMDAASAYLNWYPVFLCSQKQYFLCHTSHRAYTTAPWLGQMRPVLI